MDESVILEVHPDNRASADAWNHDDGAHWVQYADVYDRALADHTPSLFEGAAIDPGDAVLDVGCGSGHVTLDAARRASLGRATGIDVSRPLIGDACSRSRTAAVVNVDFVLGDAQVHPFEPHGFDVVVSRTGTLFFADQVAAFANLAAAVRPGGRLAVLVWQAAHANEWFQELNDALDAGRAPARPPVGAPGPFVFADPRHAAAVLHTAGWYGVEVVPHRGPMWFGPDAQGAYAFVGSQASTRDRLSGLPADARGKALDELRASLERHDSADGVVYDSAVWIVRARRP